MSEGTEQVWRRHTRQESLQRFSIQFGLTAILVWAVATLDIYWPFALDAPRQALDLARRMVPPDWAFTPHVLQPLLETINIATLGTLLAFVLAFPIAIMNARNTSYNVLTFWVARVIVVATRSVNELVWGLIFVVIFGPGAMAGTVAIAVRSIGFVAKLLAEAIEEIDRGQVEAIEATGANRSKVFLVAILPQIMPAIMGVAVYRLDINIRQSSVIGLVGAGGLGIVLTGAMNLFRWNRVAVILVAIFLVVVASETISAALRKRVT